MGCYRRGDAVDPEVYVAAVAAVLSRYPESVVRRVTDAVEGLPGRSNWLPTVAEVRVACEAEIRPMRDAEMRRLQQARSDRLLAAPGAPSPEARQRAVERYEREIRPALAKRPGDGKSPAEVKAEAEAYLVRLAQDRRPIALGDGLRAKLAAMRETSD